MNTKCYPSSRFLALSRRMSQNLSPFFLCLFALLLPKWGNTQSCDVTGFQTITVMTDKTIGDMSISGTGTNRLKPVPGSATQVQKVIIRGPGRIIFEANYTFAPGSVIIFDDYDDSGISDGFIVTNTKTLSILSTASLPTTVKGCSSMWAGILVDINSKLITQERCTIRDAFKAVTLLSGSKLTATKTTFTANYIGLSVEPVLPYYPYPVVTTAMIGNTFTGSVALAQSITVSGQTSTYPRYGVNTLQANISIDASGTPSSPNLFTDFGTTVKEGETAGIYGMTSTITVKNAEFNNIGLLDGVTSGSGFAAYGILMRNADPKFVSTLTLRGRGKTSSPATFDHVYYGIQVEKVNIDIRNARFVNGTIHINILPTTALLKYDIIGNAFRDYVEDGIYAVSVFPTAHFNVTLNDFEQANFIYQNALVNYAGYFLTSGTPTTGLTINGNTFKNNLSAYANGFLVWGGRKTTVQGNHFFVYSGGGVCLNMFQTYLSSARGNDFTGHTSGDFGFQSYNSGMLMLACNSFNTLNIGAFFAGLDGDKSALIENTFGTHNIGLYLENMAKIGPQKYRLNQWPSSNSGQVDAQFNVDVVNDPLYQTQLDASPFIIQTTETSASTYWANPRIPSGNLWFKSMINTPPSSQCSTTPPGPGNGGAGLSPTDSTVLAGTHPAYAGFDATRWDAQLRLYRNLYENPALRPTGSSGATFYSTNASAPYALLGVALAQYDQIMTPDSTLQARVDQLYSGASAAQQSVGQVDSVFTANPTPSDSTTLRATRTTQMRVTDSLNLLLGTALHNFDSIRLGQLYTLQTSVTAISVSTTYETNLKTVLGILLTTAQSDSLWHFTATQKTSLHSIAGQCSLSGGHGVMLARLLTGSTAAPNDYCTINYRSGSLSGAGRPEHWQVSPNPTTGMLQISLPLTLPSGMLELYDPFGKKVAERRIELESDLTWDLAALSNGLYYLRLTGSSQIFPVQKILLQH